MKKKIASSLLAAGMLLSQAQIDTFAANTHPDGTMETHFSDENVPDINFESSVRVVGQTDTTEWDKPGQAKSFSVFVNGNAIIENIETTKCDINNLESAREYYLIVKAYDENGKLLLESNELCAHTNLTISSNYILNEDVHAANVYINSNLNLNGYTLTVDGDVWLASGTLSVNKGKLYVGGDFNFKNTNYGYSTGYLMMQNEEDYILVSGNMLVIPYYNGSKLTAGTLEIKGDFTQKAGYHSNNFCCSGSHRVVLSGEKLQTVSFDSTQSQFNILEITKPFDVGYVFNDNAQWNELVENYTDDSAPATPTNLQFVRSTSTSVMMRWTGSADNDRLNCYEIYRDGKLVGTTTQTEFIDNGLNTHTQYEYYIVALGANGVRSESSNTIKAATDVDDYAPTTPSGLQAVIRADGSVYLTWIASSDNVSVDGYNLYRNGEYIGNTAGTAYNDKNAEPGYHEYYVEAFDNEGNNSLFSDSVYADNMPPKKPVLHVSEVTPVRITFKWDSEDNVDIDHFEIYKNGEFFRNTDSSECTDTQVIAGCEYSYYVVAIDTSGNVSEASDTKKITAKNDEEKPEVVIPEQTLTESNKALRITCIDDVLLSSLTAELKFSSSDVWISLEPESLSQKSQIVNLDLSNYLTDSGEYDIRISVSDAAGNTETIESKFNYAKNEMSGFEVAAVADGCSVRLNWTSASDNSDVYYEIRRKDANGTEKYIATTRAGELSYTDNGLYPLAEYSYFVVAHDENMYSTASNTVSVTSGKDTIAPIAYAGNSSVTIAEQSVKFDGSQSQDNYGIKEYSWNFGDGNTDVGKKASHVYSEAGTYTVTLTVTDESGNSDTDTTTVTVYGKDYSITEIQIKDDNGNILPYAAAYCELPDVKETTFYSDRSGIISLVAKSGTYDFYIFADKCLPLKQEITLNGISTGSERKTVTLTRSELVTAKYNVKELDIEEIKELGIDVTAPENQYVCKVEMKVDDVDTEGVEDFEVIVNQRGEFIQIDHNSGFKVNDKTETQKKEKKPQGTTTTTTTTSTLQGGINRSENESKKASHLIALTTMVSMSVTEYSWMKDFYEVSITITNNSGEGFDIVDSIATLNLPNGLSLASTDLSNSLSRTVNTIEGGSEETVTWIVKGDSQGSYNISVDFEGVLLPFGIPVKAHFPNETPITVIGGDALHLNIKAGIGKASFTLTNVSDKDVYNAKVNMDSYGDFDDACDIIVKYPSGLVEKIEWTDTSKTLTKSTIYLPVNMDADADIFALRTLKPGESIIGKIQYSLDTVEASDN